MTSAAEPTAGPRRPGAFLTSRAQLQRLLPAYGSMLTRRSPLLIALACVIALLVAGCGGGTHATSHQHGHKREVLVHASLGFGAFRRFIAAPARAGQLSDPLSLASKNASSAAVFADKELRLAAHDVQRDKRLRVLFAPLELTADKIKSLAPMLSRPGSLAQVEAISGILSRLSAVAKDDGARIKDASFARIAAAGGPRT